jgi:hypothetical protein
MLPAEMNCGCGMSCWRRLRDWQAAGVWRRLHQVLLERLQRRAAQHDPPVFLPRSIPSTAIVIVPLHLSSRPPCKPCSGAR